MNNYDTQYCWVLNRVNLMLDLMQTDVVNKLNLMHNNNTLNCSPREQTRQEKNGQTTGRVQTQVRSQSKAERPKSKNPGQKSKTGKSYHVNRKEWL